MTYTINIETLDDKLMHELILLMADWWYDTPMYKIIKQPLDLDAEFFKNQKVRDNLLVVTVRENKFKKLIGTYVGMLSKYHLNKKLNFCNEIFWGIKKEYRKTKVGLLLLNHIDDIMKAYNIDLWSLNMADNKVHNSLIKRNYISTDTMFMKMNNK